MVPAVHLSKVFRYSSESWLKPDFGLVNSLGADYPNGFDVIVFEGRNWSILHYKEYHVGGPWVLLTKVPSFERVISKRAFPPRGSQTAFEQRAKKERCLNSCPKCWLLWLVPCTKWSSKRSISPPKVLVLGFFYSVRFFEKEEWKHAFQRVRNMSMICGGGGPTSCL